MYTTKSVPPVALAIALALVACSSGSPNEHPNVERDAGSAPPAPGIDAGTRDVSSSAVSIPRSPLGAACSSSADCTSGFCTDGVCCDSACDQTCYACNLPAANGHCAALTSGVDPNASPACVAPSACLLLPSSSVPVCKLVDGTACQADGDCISGHCLTFFVDADGDGYGTSQQARFCEELNTPAPSGYAGYTGDCCDLDSGANPAFDSTQFLEMPDACGSFDWNCNGVVTQKSTCSTGMVACGQKCILNLFGPITLFTEACN